MGKDLYELPKGWAQVELGDILEKIDTINPSINPEQEFIYLDIASIDNSIQRITEPKKYLGKNAPSRARQLVKAGDILFSTVRTYLKNIAVVPDIYHNQIASTGFCVIRPHKKISKKFIFLITQNDNFLESLNQLQRGTSYPAVRDSDVFAQNIPLPPLPEQYRIVDKIEELFTELDAGVELLKKLKAKLKRYRQAVLKAAVDGNLTKEWREANQGKLEPASVLLERILKQRQEKWEADQLAKIKAQGNNPKDDSWKLKYKEPVAPDTSDLPELPNGWCWVTLPQIGELNRGKSKHRPRNAPHLYGGQYPFIQTGDVRNANGIIHCYTQTYSEEGLKQSRLWKKGTLCITISANIAETAILGFDACFPDSIVGFISEPNHCSINWIEFFIRTAKENLERYAPATAQKNINLEILSDLSIPLPSLMEQNKIVTEIERIFSVTDQLEKTIYTNLKRAEKLRQSILKQAFEGKLVPQDANDEPADKLLERIKAEKTKTEVEKKPKRQSKIKSSKSRKSKNPPTQLELNLNE